MAVVGGVQEVNYTLWFKSVCKLREGENTKCCVDMPPAMTLDFIQTWQKLGTQTSDFNMATWVFLSDWSQMSGKKTKSRLY